MVPPALKGDRFVTSDGTPLAMRVWLPEGEKEGAADEAKAVIVALHGFNDYSNAFAAPAEYFSRNGFATFAYDQRGFGESPHPGLWAGVDVMASDLREFTAVVRQRYPRVPLIILGESMGGAVTLAALAGEGLPQADGVVLVAPAVWGRSTMNPFQVGALWLAAHTLPWLTLTGKGLRILASDNIEMLRSLSEDQLVIKATRIDTIYGLTNLMDAALEGAARLSVPALILYGLRDEVIPVRPVKEMLKNLPEDGARKRRLAVYGRGYHMLTRDLRADVVLEDITAWIRDRRMPLPSGADIAPLERLEEVE